MLVPVPAVRSKCGAGSGPETEIACPGPETGMAWLGVEEDCTDASFLCTSLRLWSGMLHVFSGAGQREGGCHQEPVTHGMGMSANGYLPRWITI